MTWYLIGGTLGAFGLLVLLAALFADRARGRSRCPKCWYDMGGHRGNGELACPECGHRVKREKQLARTRAHPWIASIGFAILFGGAAAVATAHGGERGWVDVYPTTVLLFMIPSIDDSKSPVAVELSERLGIEARHHPQGSGPDDLGLWSWQRRLLAERCARAIELDRPVAARSLALILCWSLGPEAEPALGTLVELLASNDPTLVLSVVRVIKRIGPVEQACVPPLTELISRDPSSCALSLTGAIRSSAIRALGMFGADARPAVPAIVEILEVSTAKTPTSGPPASLRESQQLEAIRTLGRIGPDAEIALPFLMQRVQDRSSPLRVAALIAIGRIDATRPDTSATMILALKDVEVTLRTAAADIARQHPALLEQSVDALVLDLENGAPSERVASARSLMTLGVETRRAVPALRAALADDDILVRLFAARALGTIGPAAMTATAELRETTTDSDESVRREAVRALAALRADEE